MKYIEKLKDNRVCSFLNDLNENRVLVYASSAAFYFFISIIPILMIMCFILPYTTVEMSDLNRMVNSLIPDEVNGFTKAIISELSDQSKMQMSFAVFLVLWSASRGIVAIGNGLNMIYGLKREPGMANCILYQIKSMFYTVFFIILIIAWLLIMTVSKDMINFVGQWFPKMSAFFLFWLRKGHAVSFITMTVSMFFMYVFLPEKNIRTAIKNKNVTRLLLTRLFCAAIASFLWTVLAILFSWWVHNYATFSIYGSLTTIIFSLYWMYVGMVIIMIGAQLGQRLSVKSKKKKL